MTYKKTLMAAASGLTLAMFCTTAAHAQTSRIYFAGYLGLNTFNDQNFTESSTGNNGDFELDNATSFAGAMGIRLSRQLRFETELSYRNAEFSSVDVAGVGSFDSGGELDSTIALASLYYDFDVPWKTQPYIGAGIGYGWHGGEISDGSGSLVNANVDDAGLVWSGAMGVKYRPRTDFAFNLGYRYLGSEDLEIGSYEMEYDTHEFRLGFEWDLPTR